MNHVKNPNSNIQPDKHRSRKLQQTPVRAASDIFCDRWKHRRGGAIIVGGTKMLVGGCRSWSFSYLVSCGTFMNQKKVGSKDPTEQVGHLRSSLSAPTQEVAATRLLCLLTILLPFQDIFNIPSLLANHFLLSQLQTGDFTRGPN